VLHGNALGLGIARWPCLVRESWAIGGIIGVAICNNVLCVRLAVSIPNDSSASVSTLLLQGAGADGGDGVIGFSAFLGSRPTVF